jgi:mono/diheme cytochrome c family protein
MPKSIGLLSAWFTLVATITQSVAADSDQGKLIAERWCASCHLVAQRRASATDQAPPFTQFAMMPGFDENKLAFLLLAPHPSMPTLSLSRREASDLAAYIISLK